MDLHTILQNFEAPPIAATDRDLNRITHRVAGQQAVLKSDDYVVVARTLPHWLPPGPNPYDLSRSKRTWEANVMQWRRELQVLRGRYSFRLK